ncbi:MAG: Calx-beta domain-containing protein, partial [Nitrolancea sp.]
AQYRAELSFPEPTAVVLTGDARWTTGFGNGAVVYIQRYASFEIVARIGGLGSFNVDTPFELSGHFVLHAVASEPANDSGNAHYNFALSLSPLPSISIGDATDFEGPSGTADLTFPVFLSDASSSIVSVDYGVQDDTAQAGTDYGVTTGTLTFAPGETSKTITVPISGDTDIEPDETFNVILSDPTNATIADGIGLGTILNDDFAVDFDWTVPNRFDGQDHNGDGLADYFAPDGPLVIDPARWEIDFTYTNDGSCASGLDQTWRINGIEVPESDPAVIALDAQTCTFSYGFADEGNYSVELELRSPTGDLVGTQQHDVVVQDWLIVSIGDSVASGEGNPDLPGGASAQWEDAQCHRSATAGPAQAAADIELADPKTSVTFIHLACSGATIFKGLLGPYGGVIRGRPLPPQLEALQAFAGGREIDAVLVSIGANDVHFSDVVQGCLLQAHCDAERPGTARFRFERDLTRLPSAYDQLATALNLLPLEPQRIYITQYYDPMHDDSGQICADSVLGDIPVLPRLGFSITADEATWASTTMLPSLNAEVAASATNHGWNFVGGILPQFITHGYCATDHWVVHFRESFAQQGDQNGTIHPNASGHQVYGNAIAGALTAAFYANGDLSQPRLPASAAP